MLDVKEAIPDLNASFSSLSNGSSSSFTLLIISFNSDNLKLFSLTLTLSSPGDANLPKYVWSILISNADLPVNAAAK